MQTHSLSITHNLTQRTPNKPSTGGSKSGAGEKGSNPFPGGNWPSKVPGVKSGGNRGQGSKA